jgi:hypothetical protein
VVPEVNTKATDQKKSKPDKSAGATVPPQKTKEQATLDEKPALEKEEVSPNLIPELTKTQFDENLTKNLETRFEYFRGTNYLDTYSLMIDEH